MTGWPRRPSGCWSGTLSPSRAADFKACPLVYRFRSVDKLPQRPTPDKARGTLVHAVLDRLFDLPAAERTYDRAAELVEPEWAGWARPSRRSPRCSPAEGRAGRAGWPRPAGLVAGYFALEDPTRLEPDGREELVEVPTSRPTGSAARLRRPARRRADRRAEGRRLQDRRDTAGGVRGQGPVPDEVLRAGAVAHPGLVPHQLKLMYLGDATRSPTRPTRPSCSGSSARWSRSGRRSSARSPRATSGRTRAGSAAGATTRRCARPFGGTPPPFPGAEAAADGSEQPSDDDVWWSEPASTDRWRRMSNRGVMCRPLAVRSVLRAG